MIMSENKKMQAIKIVADNQEKYISYQKNFIRYKKAKASGFYLECAWILYAMLEDRASAFLYHIGFTSEEKRTSITHSKKIKKQIRSILGMADEKEKYKFETISGKLLRINGAIAWSVKANGEITDYQKSIKKVLIKLANDEAFMATLKYLDNEWRDSRNQLTHALFNKDPETVSFILLPFIEGGYKAIRALDSAVDKLKKEKIRKRYKIQ